MKGGGALRSPAMDPPFSGTRLVPFPLPFMIPLLRFFGDCCAGRSRSAYYNGRFDGVSVEVGTLKGLPRSCVVPALIKLGC